MKSGKLESLPPEAISYFQELSHGVDLILGVLIGSDAGLALIKAAKLQEIVDEVTQESAWWKALHDD
jgi:hypothetical protein